MVLHSLTIVASPHSHLLDSFFKDILVTSLGDARTNSATRFSADVRLGSKNFVVARILRPFSIIFIHKFSYFFLILLLSHSFTPLSIRYFWSSFLLKYSFLCLILHFYLYFRRFIVQYLVFTIRFYCFIIGA